MPILDKIAEKLHLKPTASNEESAKSELVAKKCPTFDNSKITVIFVLGGPGAGMRLQLIRSQVCNSSPV
jgi:UMP-CMP kinase